MTKSWGFAGLFSLIFTVLGTGVTAEAGLCSMDKTVPGLPKASCQMPSCPAGIDCQPPEISRDAAQVKYGEPLIRWQDNCSEPSFDKGPCWEVFLDFAVQFDALDASGISSVGANLAQEVSARRIFKKFMASVTSKGKSGKWEMQGTMTAHVPPGQRLDIDVYELCARDANGNESCALPIRRLDLGFKNAQSSLNLDDKPAYVSRPVFSRRTADEIRAARAAQENQGN